jgi:response regulator RpfG family c-di-GMP phosphodiesterase
LTHARPYKDAWNADRAVAVITSQAGLQFDPRVVDAFLALDVENLPGRLIPRGAAPPAA